MYEVYFYKNPRKIKTLTILHVFETSAEAEHFAMFELRGIYEGHALYIRKN